MLYTIKLRIEEINPYSKYIWTSPMNEQQVPNHQAIFRYKKQFSSKITIPKQEVNLKSKYSTFQATGVSMSKDEYKIFILWELGLKIEKSQIFYENANTKMYMYLGTFPFEQQVLLNYEYCTETVIRLRYKKISDTPSMESNAEIPKNSKAFNQKCIANNKERIIGEVVEIVKKWRKICGELDEQGKKKFTLTSGAEIVGVNKKTLDDYAYQVQFGYDFNFDFEKNRNEKIGILRKFVKEKRKELQIMNDTDRYWGSEESSGSEDR